MKRERKLEARRALPTVPQQRERRGGLNKFRPGYLRRFGFKAETLVDVGVFNGTPRLYKMFLNRRILLVDPLPGAREKIAQIFDGQFEYEFVEVALGAQPGRAVLHIIKENRGKASIRERNALLAGETVEEQEVEVTTLDALLASRSLPKPYGIKIDTEGHELDVLRGADATLRDTEFVIAEVSVKKRFAGSYRFSEVIALMAEHGFELADILIAKAPPPAFFDCLFLRREHPSFNFVLRRDDRGGE